MKKINLSGFLMFEVLISLSLIALIFLSLLSYQVALLKDAEALNFKTIATQQLLNFSEMLLVAKTDSDKQLFFSQWRENNNAWLPKANSDWSKDTNHHCVIQLRWFFKQEMFRKISVYC